MVDQEKIHSQCLSDDPEERIHALEQLEEFFDLMPDKEQAWNDLHRLINDEDRSVKSSSTHSLGRVSIFMAFQAETCNDYKKTRTVKWLFLNNQLIFARVLTHLLFAFIFCFMYTQLPVSR